MEAEATIALYQTYRVPQFQQVGSPGMSTLTATILMSVLCLPSQIWLLLRTRCTAKMNKVYLDGKWFRGRFECFSARRMENMCLSQRKSVK